MPHHVAGEHVIAFVPCERLAMNDVHELSGLNGNKSDDNEPNKTILLEHLSELR